MNLTLKQFTLSQLILFVAVFYILFGFYYMRQQEQTATVIVKNFKNDLSRFSYILSKYVKKESVLSSRSLLDSEAANNDFIAAIAIFDGDQMVVTSDPSFSRMLSSEMLYHKPDESAHDRVLNYTGYTGLVHYYDGNKMKNYTLVYFVDRDAVSEVFNTFRKEFLIAFVVIPIILIIFAWLLILRVVIRPLETLRQYAYYQSTIPNKFMLKEMEYIRSSMVQTFYRLEVERKELYDLSRTDVLSGLANRNLFEERSAQIISESQRNKKEFALLFLDLDHFKSVNDSLGHDVGDELLCKVAKSISDQLRVNDVVARIGGDEFAIIITHYKDANELVEIINRIQEKLLQTWLIQTYSIHISSSVGIALFPKDGSDLLTLMKHADIAMYEAKDNGRRQYRFYTEELNIQTQNYIEIANGMHEALENSDFKLFYQPQNSVETGKIIGAEALIRWFSSDKGMISPAEFIPIAEQNGFIIKLGRWVLQEAIKQKSLWEQEGIGLELSINIAAKQVSDPDFIEHLKDLLMTYKINTSEVSFEITEYVFLGNIKYIHGVFETIKSLGFKISLDDFGTGYSSLAYLRSFPIDILKIDKSFLDDFDTKDGATFLETITLMAKSLELNVVAEGVEEEAQIDYLKTLSCTYYQGYVCSRPLDIEGFNRLYLESM